MGLIQPLVSLALNSSAKVLHLTALNPHIGNVMKAAAASSSGGSSGGKVTSIHNPRQNSGAASSRGGGVQAQRISCGVGAFAFQGTNAHAIVVITPPRAATGAVGVHCGGSGGGCGLVFKRRRHWPLPTFGSLWRAAPEVLSGGGEDPKP